MEKSPRLVAAVAEKCKSVIQASEDTPYDVPESLRPEHLAWMCDRIQRYAEDWPETKLHRWIGFVQCGMMANRIVGFDGIKEIVEEVKKSHGETGEDQDLIDHLDPDSSFRLDIGGEG